MKRRLAAALGMCLVPAFSAARAHAQATTTPPRTYSFTSVGNLFFPDQAIKVYRDGDRELIDTTFPVSAERPNGYHDRTLYDFKARKQYVWMLDDPSNTACGVQPLDPQNGPLMWDAISGYRDGLAEIAAKKPGTIANETLNGIATRVIETTDDAAQVTVRIWLAVKGDYVLKVVMTKKGEAPRVMGEVKNLRFEKPAAAELVLPANCVAAEREAATPPKGSTLAKMSAVNLQVSLAQYTGKCAPGHMQLVASITSEGPGTAWYKFHFGDLTFAQGDEGTITFARAGTQTLTKDVTFTFDPGTRISNAGGYITVAMLDDARNHGPETNTQGPSYNITCTAAK